MEGMSYEHEGDGSELLEKVHQLKKKMLKIKAKLYLLQFLAQHHETSGKGLGSAEMEKVAIKMRKMHEKFQKSAEKHMLCKMAIAHFHHHQLEDEEEGSQHQGMHILVEKLKEKKMRIICKLKLKKMLLIKLEQYGDTEKIEKIKMRFKELKEKKEKLVILIMLAHMLLTHSHGCS